MEGDGRYIIEQFKSEVLMQTGESTSARRGVEKSNLEGESTYRSSIGFERLSLDGAKIEISGKTAINEEESMLIENNRNSAGYTSRDSIAL